MLAEPGAPQADPGAAGFDPLPAVADPGADPGEAAVEKLLEDAQIELSSVISDIFGVSGRETLGALIAGQRNPKVLARMARGTMRSKIAVLEEVLTSHFEDHHGFIAQAMLEHIDALTAQIADRAD